LAGPGELGRCRGQRGGRALGVAPPAAAVNVAPGEEVHGAPGGEEVCT